MKSCKESRLRIFSSYNDALEYSNSFIGSSFPEVLFKCFIAIKPKNKGEYCPFRNIKQAEYCKFRTAIERGDIAFISNCILSNPLWLVTSSDSPTLLQLRLRYNALHIAAAAGRSEMISLFLQYLDSVDIWQALYPFSDIENCLSRQKRVLDFYLNSPETGVRLFLSLERNLWRKCSLLDRKNLETPLHFASKFCRPGCVRALLSHPLTIPTIRNRGGFTPREVAATRWSRKLMGDDTISFGNSGNQLTEAKCAEIILQIFDER
ncbi:unnamed protein product [Protopolystoma xenopodis]|uniref:Uncharacterized protein n=1 Tax=Protopolystoma xenopodis TaxID=117903 RepID=A0A3S4ZY73_9PLAT|nr:unnamed protein product [Protopolystoma xenopodis]